MSSPPKIISCHVGLIDYFENITEEKEKLDNTLILELHMIETDELYTHDTRV